MKPRSVLPMRIAKYGYIFTSVLLCAAGVALLALGTVVLLRSEDAVSFVCTVFGVCMSIDALFRIQTALEARRFGIRRWWLTLALAVLACLAGLVLTLRPAETLGAVTSLLGVALIVEGVLNLSVAVRLVKIIDHQKPDVIEAEYEEL